MRSVVALGLAIALSGCGGGNKEAADNARLEEAAKSLVRQKLKDPSSAEFSNIKVSSFQGSAVVCGEVNSKNAFGGMAGAQRFVSGGMTVLEEEAAPGAMDEIWSKACL